MDFRDVNCKRNASLHGFIWMNSMRCRKWRVRTKIGKGKRVKGVQRGRQRIWNSEKYVNCELWAEISLPPLHLGNISSTSAKPHFLSSTGHHFSSTVFVKIPKQIDLCERRCINMPDKVVRNGERNSRPTIQQSSQTCCSAYQNHHKI
jgi:hypothetical protein